MSSNRPNPLPLPPPPHHPSVSVPSQIPLRPLPVPPSPVISPPRLPPRNASTSTPHWHKLDPVPASAPSVAGPPLPPRRPTRNPKRKVPPLPDLASTQSADPPALPPRANGSIDQLVEPSEPDAMDVVDTQDTQLVDQQGADDMVGELPSYDLLREQAERSEGGRDSQRFGRWKGWIEKRAGERHLDEQHALEDQLAENRRRSNLGWGAGNYLPRSGSDPLLPAETEAAFFAPPSASSSTSQVPQDVLPPRSSINALTTHPSIQTIMTTATVGHVAPSSPVDSVQTSSLAPIPLIPTQAVYRPLGQSMFLPHLPPSAGVPQCLLPLDASPVSLLLIGTEDGLWVFDPVREEPARAVFLGSGVKHMRILGEDQVIMLCRGLVGDVRGEVRVWEWKHLTAMAQWISESIEPPSPFSLPISATPTPSSFSFRSSQPSASSSATSSLSVSVPRPLRTLAGALHTQHNNVPLLNIHHSISGSIKRRMHPSPHHRHDHDDEGSEFTVQSDNIPELPPRSRSLSPYPGRTESGSDETSSHGGSGTRDSDNQTKDFLLLSLPVGMSDPGLIEVWTETDGSSEKRNFVAVSGKGTVCVYQRTDELELTVFRELYLPPQPKPLSAMSFVPYWSTPSSTEPQLRSLALFFNFSGGKTILIDLESARLVELDWPTFSALSSPPRAVTNSNGLTNTLPVAQISPSRAQRESTVGEWEAAKERWSAKGKSRTRGRSFAASTEGSSETTSASPSMAVDSTLGGGGGSVKAFVGSVLGSVGLNTSSGVGPGGGSRWIGGIEQAWFSRGSILRGFCLLTRGKETCVWPLPLSVPLSPVVHTFVWPHVPSSVSSYISSSLSQDGSSTETLTVGAVYSSFLSHQVTIDCQSVDLDLDPALPSHQQQPSSPVARVGAVTRATKDLGQQAGLFDLSYPACHQVRPEAQVRWGWDYRGSDDWRFFELKASSQRS